MGMAKKTGEKKRKGGAGGLPAQKAKTDASSEVGKMAMAVAEEARAKKLKKKAAKEVAVEEVEKVEEEGEVEERVEEEGEVEERVDERVLPTVHTDGKLAGIVKKARKQESLAASASPAFLSLASPGEDKSQQEVEVKKPRDVKGRSVVYLSHVPHGFYEKQMRQFFSQFGTVTNLRLGRSKKTGRSCGFAFVEFKYREVATVVAETMNNYLMFDRILKCSLVPKERTSKAIFRGKIRESKPPAKVARMKAKRLHNAVKCEETVQKRQVRQVNRVKKSMAKLKKAGIDYNFKIAEMSDSKK